MAAHAKTVNIWGLVAMAMLTGAVITVVFLMQVDNSNASPVPPDQPTPTSSSARVAGN
ncbi:hypothetical protein OK074_1811 [Actinobacteria bacterium OK074]|nr:hypothetical protein OK074_1811 [Actinobacteria bacterium OK074]